jgi:hypothetical protein
VHAVRATVSKAQSSVVIGSDFRIILTFQIFTPLQIVLADFRHPQSITAFGAVPVHIARLCEPLVPKVYIMALVGAVRPPMMLSAQPDSKA